MGSISRLCLRKTAHGKQKRKFTFSWLRKYKWLSYSAVEGSTYCTYCVLFTPKEVGMQSAQKSGQLVQEGYCNCKKAIEKI